MSTSSPVRESGDHSSSRSVSSFSKNSQSNACSLCFLLYACQRLKQRKLCSYCMVIFTTRLLLHTHCYYYELFVVYSCYLNIICTYLYIYHSSTVFLCVCNVPFHVLNLWRVRTKIIIVIVLYCNVYIHVYCIVLRSSY